MQHVEIGYALLNETNDLGIHDHAAFDASSFLYDARVTFRPIGAIHREQSYTPIADVDLQSIAIMLQLKRLTRTCRGCLATVGRDGWMKAAGAFNGRRVIYAHATTCVRYK